MREATIEGRESALGTVGGPKTDAYGHVLRADGSVVEGLFSSGNAGGAPTKGFYGGAGGTISLGLVFGYLAGVTAAEVGEARITIAETMLLARELAAAASITRPEQNVQTQTAIVWPITFALAGAYLDQAGRDPSIVIDVAAAGAQIDTAAAAAAADPTDAAIRTNLNAALAAADTAGATTLADTLTQLLAAYTTRPAAPTGLAADNTPPSTDVELTWVAPVEHGGSAITGYRVETSSDGGATWSTVGDTTAPELVITGLERGVTHRFRVVAVNAVGDSAASAPVDVPVADRPEAPADLAAAPGDTTIGLAWSAPTDGGAAIDHYVIEVVGAGLTSTITTSDASTAYDLGRIYEDHLASLTRGEFRAEQRRRYHERFQWFLALGLLVLFAGAALPEYPRSESRVAFRRDSSPICT